MISTSYCDTFVAVVRSGEWLWIKLSVPVLSAQVCLLIYIVYKCLFIGSDVIDPLPEIDVASITSCQNE